METDCTRAVGTHGGGAASGLAGLHGGPFSVEDSTSTLPLMCLPVEPQPTRTARIGRPVNVLLSEDELREFRTMRISGATYEDLKRKFGLSESAVYRILKANNLVDDKQLPTLEQLQQFFRDTDYKLYHALVPQAMRHCSEHFGLSEKVLRNHFRAVGFDPKHPWSLDEVCEMFEEVKKRPYFNQWCVHVCVRACVRACVHAWIFTDACALARTLARA